MAKKKKTAGRKKTVGSKKKTVKKAVKKKTTGRKTAKKKTLRKVVKKVVKKKKRKANSAFMKNHRVTDELKAVVGTSSISRPQAMKKIWAYIKSRKGLHDKVNRKQINVGKDPALSKLFPRKKSVTMFELPKMVSRNIISD